MAEKALEKSISISFVPLVFFINICLWRHMLTHILIFYGRFWSQFRKTFNFFSPVIFFLLFKISTQDIVGKIQVPCSPIVASQVQKAICLILDLRKFYGWKFCANCWSQDSGTSLFCHVTSNLCLGISLCPCQLVNPLVADYFWKHLSQSTWMWLCLISSLKELPCFYQYNYS